MKHFIEKKLFISLIILAAAIIFATIFAVTHTNSSKSKAPAPAETAGQSEKLILGFSQIGSESAWRTRNTQSIFEAAESNGIQILFDDAQQKHHVAGFDRTEFPRLAGARRPDARRG